jgi:hypothetical protein
LILEKTTLETFPLVPRPLRLGTVGSFEFEAAMAIVVLEHWGFYGG